MSEMHDVGGSQLESIAAAVTRSTTPAPEADVALALARMGLLAGDRLARADHRRRVSRTVVAAEGPECELHRPRLSDGRPTPPARPTGSAPTRTPATSSRAPSYGARVSLMVGFSAIASGMIIGGTLGTIAGYFRGTFDRVISFLFLVLLSFPALVLAILITSLLDRSLLTISADARLPGDRTGRPARPGHDDPVRRARVRAGGPHVGRPTPTDHHPRAAPQRRDPDGSARAARHGRRDRRRGRSGLPRAVGREGGDVGQVDPPRLRKPRSRERTVDLDGPDLRVVPDRAGPQLRRRPGASTTSTCGRSACERHDPSHRSRRRRHAARGHRPHHALPDRTRSRPGRRRCHVRARTRQVARHRRRVRFRQDGAEPHDHGAAAVDRGVGRFGAVRRARRSSGSTRSRCGTSGAARCRWCSRTRWCR